jgi:RNA polymerase sigma factor (sigma-70 family)
MYDEKTDTELLFLSRERPDAFSALYERHAEALLGFFGRRTLDPEAAAELTSETFAEAFASRARFRDVGSGGAAWLYGIGKHKLARFFRSGRIEDAARVRLGMPRRELDSDDYDRIEELVDLEPLRLAVADAMEELSHDQRQATRLRILEARPYSEVAARIGCSEATARARVSRAMRRLAKTLESRSANVVAEVD